MNLGKKCFFGLFMLIVSQIGAQQVAVEGYIYESNNRGFLKKVKILILDAADNSLYLDTLTNTKGVFYGLLPKGKDFKIIADKKHFFQTDTTISTRNLPEAQLKIFTKIEMDRKPGYVFDVTMAQASNNLLVTESIQGAQIEIYNNTTSKEELVLKEYPYPNFKFTFENGNHYTVMIRKKGFFTKRMEAYVNVEGCILCFEGLGIIKPDVTDVMTDNNKQGTFLANVELQAAELNSTFRIENIYYDYNKSDIRKDAAQELDKLVTIIKDNPAIKLEIGSHTDSRGSAAYNTSLSAKRAKAAVDYLIDKGADPMALTDKGYGELLLANRCKDGVTCSNEEHQFNRRTELKIVGIAADDPLEKKPLKDIINEERMMEEINNTPEFRAGKGN